MLRLVLDMKGQDENGSITPRLSGQLTMSPIRTTGKSPHRGKCVTKRCWNCEIAFIYYEIAEESDPLYCSKGLLPVSLEYIFVLIYFFKSQIANQRRS